MSHAALTDKSFVFKRPAIGRVIVNFTPFTLHSGHRNRRHRFHDFLIPMINWVLEVFSCITLGTVGAHKEHGCPILVVFNTTTYMIAQVTLILCSFYFGSGSYTHWILLGTVQ
jgi:hypothetical protein